MSKELLWEIKIKGKRYNTDRIGERAEP